MFKKITNGAGWGLFKIISVQLINFTAIAILSRVLDLSDFGLVALANSALIFFNIFSTQGINQFLIYDNSGKYYEKINAVFWLNLIISSSLVIIAILLIPRIKTFLNEPLLGDILLVLFLRLPFDVISKLPDAILQKKLKFKQIEIRDTVLQFSSSFGSVFMALNGYGVWSLIIPSIIALPIRLIISFSLVAWRPKFKLYYSHWKEILNYSKHIIGGSLANYTLTQGDTIMVGSMFGATSLGVYNLAWQSSNLFSRTMVKLINKIAFPAFSAFKGDINLIKINLDKVLFSISILSFPILMWMMVSAEYIIVTIYGNKWVDAILPFQILLIYAIRYSVGAPIGSVFKSLGRPDLNFKLGVSIIPFYLLGIWIGSSYSIIGVAVAVTFVRTVFGLASFWIVANLLKTTFFTIIKQLKTPFISSLIMSLSCLILDKLVLKYYFDLSSLSSLFILAAFGSLLYIGLIKYIFTDIWCFMIGLYSKIKIK